MGWAQWSLTPLYLLRLYASTTFKGISCRTITLLTFPRNFLNVSLVEYFTEFRLFILGFLRPEFIAPLRSPLLPAPHLDSLCLMFCPFLPTVLHALSPMSQLPSGITNCREARLGEAFPFKFFLATHLLYGFLASNWGWRETRKINGNICVCTYLYITLYVCSSVNVLLLFYVNCLYNIANFYNMHPTLQKILINIDEHLLKTLTLCATDLGFSEDKSIP